MRTQAVEKIGTSQVALTPFRSVKSQPPAMPARALAEVGKDAEAPRETASKTIDFVDIQQRVMPDIGSSALRKVGFSLTSFQSSEWLNAWQGNIGETLGSEPFTAIGYSGGRPAFILPLAITRRFGARCLTWSAYQQSDYCAPILDPSCKDALSHIDGEKMLRDIASRIGGIDLVYVPKQPRAIGGIANPFVLPDAVSHHAGAHAINFLSGESWEEAFQRRRSAKTRRRLREKRASLEKCGAVSFRIANTEAEARRLIDACLTAKSEQLARLGHWDPFSPEGVREFLVDYFSTNIGHSTWAVTLEVGNATGATAFGFRNGSEWLLYQMAMSSGPEARHSPGTHLLMELMRHCTEQCVARLDLALGDEPYKAEWCDEHIDLMTSAVGITLRGKLLERMVRLRAAARLRLAADAKLYERAKWLRGIIRNPRQAFS